VGSGSAFASATNPIAAAEWALSTLNVTAVRQQFDAHGAGVTVAVIDTGVDPNQPDLQGRLVDGVNLTDPNNPTSDYADTNNESHGTSVATVVGGHPHTDSSGDDYGMIGLADGAKIMPIKVSEDGSVPSGSLAAGIQYAVSHGAQVINMSISGATLTSDMTSALNAALAHGIVVVVSADNEAKTGNAVNVFAAFPGVIDVAGVDSNGQKYSEGHSGPDVDVAAPANSIEVGLAGGKYGTNSGTSFAAPWVAGEAALLIAKHPTWTSGQIVATIVDNTMQVAGGQTKAGQRFDNNIGYGVIDPVAALGASEPSSTANPLGGPAVTSSPGAGASATAPATTSTASKSKSSSSAPLIIGIVVAAVVVVGLLIFFLSRGNRNRGGKGKGGPGAGGGGDDGNVQYGPQVPPGGGQYGQGSPYQQPSPYPQQQPGAQQPNQYPPQQGNQYPQSPQQPGPYPQQPPQGGYPQPPQNPYSGR
jgi:subtilisin family serine protease